MISVYLNWFNKSEYRNTWPCPHCHGLGHMNNGGGSIGYNETTKEMTANSTPNTFCLLCNGKGVVLVNPLPDS